MKVLTANGKLQQIPFELGEAGIGRHLEKVTVNGRTPPTGPDNVGFTLWGENGLGHPHVMLTESSGQRGILLRINTQGVYTRDTQGKVTHWGGSAKLLTRGRYAYGDAGGLGGATDELWHVEGPALFTVYLAGGSYKGYGHRYLIITRSFRVVMIEREALCTLIATDDDPEVIETVREFLDVLHKDVKDAFETAEKLEAAMDAAPVAVSHLVEYGDIQKAISDMGLKIPAAMAGGNLGGVSGVHSGTLMPGEKALLHIVVGPRGGKRYGYSVMACEGITQLKNEKSTTSASEVILGLIDQPDWCIAWEEEKDRSVSAYVLADAGGIHRVHPETGDIYSREWSGMPLAAPSWDVIRRIFFK